MNKLRNFAKPVLGKLIIVCSVMGCSSVYSSILGKDKRAQIDECLTSPASKSKEFIEFCKKKLAEGQEAALQGDQQAIDEVGREVARLRSEERLKLGFVDVNSVMETLGSSMDWTANWIDGQFADSKDDMNKAKAWGHVVVGWEPRDGEWANFPVKFRVRAKLPNLQNKAELILSDNEQEDINKLPYETVRPEALKSSQRSLGAAVRFLHKSSDDLDQSSRIGWGDGQLYARTSLLYRKNICQTK